METPPSISAKAITDIFFTECFAKGFCSFKELKVLVLILMITAIGPKVCFRCYITLLISEVMTFHFKDCRFEVLFTKYNKWKCHVWTHEKQSLIYKTKNIITSWQYYQPSLLFNPWYSIWRVIFSFLELPSNSFSLNLLSKSKWPQLHWTKTMVELPRNWTKFYFHWKGTNRHYTKNEIFV